HDHAADVVDGLLARQRRHQHRPQWKDDGQYDDGEQGVLAEPSDQRRRLLPDGTAVAEGGHDLEYTPCSPSRWANRLAMRMSVNPTNPLNSPAAAPKPHCWVAMAL